MSQRMATSLRYEGKRAWQSAVSNTVIRYVEPSEVGSNLVGHCLLP